MTRWALVVKQLIGSNANKFLSTHLLEEVTGTREHALAALWHHAQTFRPQHPFNVNRRVVCQDGDGFLVINRGISDAQYACEFRIHEVLWEWNAPVTGA